MKNWIQILFRSELFHVQNCITLSYCEFRRDAGINERKIETLKVEQLDRSSISPLGFAQ